MIGKIESMLTTQHADSGSHPQDQRGNDIVRCLKEFGVWSKRYGHLWSGDTHIERGIKVQKDGLHARLSRLHDILGPESD